jgi:hypothetical protein
MQNFVARALILAFLLVPLTAAAQTSTPFVDPNNPSLTGMQTVTTTKLDNGNTLETTTAEATGVIDRKYVTETYTYSTEKDKDGNKVRYNRKLVRTTFDKKGEKQLARDGWTEKDTYNEAGGAARLEDGSQTTSAPVIDGIAQVRIRGISAGAALVKFKLQARINGFWT